MYKTKTQSIQYIPKNVDGKLITGGDERASLSGGKPNNTIKNNNNNHTLSYEEIRKIVENKPDKEILNKTEEKPIKNKFSIV